MAKERENLKRLKCLRRYRQRYGVEALLHRQLRERRVLATDGAAQQVRGDILDGSLLSCLSGSDPRPWQIPPSCKDSPGCHLPGFGEAPGFVEAFGFVGASGFVGAPGSAGALGSVGALGVHTLNPGVSFGLLAARKTLRVKSREGNRAGEGTGAQREGFGKLLRRGRSWRGPAWRKGDSGYLWAWGFLGAPGFVGAHGFVTALRFLGAPGPE